MSIDIREKDRTFSALIAGAILAVMLYPLHLRLAIWESAGRRC